MSFECYGSHDLLCVKTQYLDRNIYTKEILISKFTKETTLEDLRIRFSIYGDIKDCYWFPLFSPPKKDRQACIIFKNSYSGMRAVKHGRNKEIYLHGKMLKIRVKFVNKERLQEYLQNHRGSTSINELSDDCLLQIFDYVSIIERFKLRKVCKHWCTIANMSLEMLLHLDLKIYSQDLKNLENFDHEKQLLELFRNLDQRQIRAEKSLSYYKTHAPLNIIASLNMHLLAIDCRNLTKLIIRCSTYDEDILSRILMVNQKLRHIEIHRNKYITGKSLIHLPEKIHTFIVEGCQNLQSNHLWAGLKRLKNLKCLKLIDHVGYDILHIFNEYCQNLETLELYCWGENDSHLETTYGDSIMDFNIFLPITNLKNLRDLKICGADDITETFLVNLSKNCQKLRRLKLSHTDSWRISERGINAITSLTKLQILFVYCRGIDFADLRGLQKINLYSCDIQDIVTIMRNSPELKHLSIFRCNNIQEHIFSEARIMSATRCNNVMLELITGYAGKEEITFRRCVIFNGKIY